MIVIRNMTEADIENVLEMMRVFYASPAVLSNGSETIFQQDVENCINDCPYLEGYIFEKKGQILGYAMAAKSFSTEFGKPCIWLEDLYIKEDYRSKGIGTQFLAYIEQKYPNCVIRLEVEEENKNAMHVYQKCGFEIIAYTEMKKELIG